MRGSRPCVPAPAAFLAAGLVLGAPPPAAAQTDGAPPEVVAGRVTVAGTDQPVPLALVSAPGTGARIFAGADGSFRLRLPAGAETLVVEQLGFEPWHGPADAAAGPTRSLRVELVPRALDVEGLRVAVVAPRCESPGFAAGTDGGASRVLDEARRNAERYRTLLEEHPLTARYERLRRYVREDGSVAGEDVDTVAHDSREPGWAYAPGQVLERDDRGGVVFHVPSLRDLAGGAFQATHCFHYAGALPAGRERLLAVEFRPGRDLGGPDVAGALHLEPSTGLVRGGRFEVTDLPDDIHVRELRVDVGYREIRPRLVVPGRIRTVQRLHRVRFRGEPVAIYEAEERLIDVVFGGRDPAPPPGLAPGPAPHPPRR